MNIDKNGQPPQPDLLSRLFCWGFFCNFFSGGGGGVLKCHVTKICSDNNRL